MIKICQNCHKINTDRYKFYCKNCYYGLRSNPTGYTKKTFKEQLLNTPCENCNKIRVNKNDINKNLCRYCYINKRKNDRPEIHEKHKKLCRDYQRKKRGINTELPLLNAPAGSGYIGKNGYKKICKIQLRGHPNADKKGALYEHTYVMSKYLNRPLFKHETIHHKNGVRHDNRIENLELRSSHHGPGQKVKDKIEWCIEFLNIYGYDVNKR